MTSCVTRPTRPMRPDPREHSTVFSALASPALAVSSHRLFRASKRASHEQRLSRRRRQFQARRIQAHRDHRRPAARRRGGRLRLPQRAQRGAVADEGGGQQGNPRHPAPAARRADAALAQVGGRRQRAAPAAGGVRPPLVGQGQAEHPARSSRGSRRSTTRCAGRRRWRSSASARPTRTPRSPPCSRPLGEADSARQAADLLGARRAPRVERVRHGHGRVPPRAPRRRCSGSTASRRSTPTCSRGWSRSTRSRRSRATRATACASSSRRRSRRAPIRSGPTRSSSSCRTSRSRSRARPPSASARSAATRRRSRSSTRSRRPTRTRARSSSQALRDGIGATGLVLALKTRAAHDSAETREVPDEADLRHDASELEDPRGGDALYAYIQTQPQAALEDRGGDAPGRDRRRPRGRGRSAGA